MATDSIRSWLLGSGYVINNLVQALRSEAFLIIIKKPNSHIIVHIMSDIQTEYW